MPGARCTRSLARSEESTRVSHHRYVASSDIPCAMVLTVSFVLSPVIGFVATVPAQCNALSRVNASIEASGPHDFTVRAPITRQLTGSRPSHPALNVRDDRDTSLS
jgi:hypothetical protein